VVIFFFLSWLSAFQGLAKTRLLWIVQYEEEWNIFALFVDILRKLSSDYMNCMKLGSVQENYGYTSVEFLRLRFRDRKLTLKLDSW